MRTPWFLLALGVGACSSTCGERSGAHPDPVDAAPVVKAAARADAGDARSLVDLLRYTDAQVAVSSRVDNPHDHPEHLVDGNPETAWNGRTGDLVGGYILFSVPDDSEVEAIELSAGFDKKTAAEDLFTANHRIKKVRITRNGALVREATLDVDKRKPQHIDVKAKGGTFEIEVLEVVPGTRKQWRELVVSELAVLGRPGANRRATPRVPIVHVGGLVKEPARSGADLSAPYPSLDAFCAQHTKMLEQFFADKPTYYGVDQRPFCAVDPKPLLTSKDGPFKSVRTATIWDLEASERVQLAFVETQAGFFASPARVPVTAKSMQTCGPRLVAAQWLETPEILDRARVLLGVVAASGSSAYGTEDGKDYPATMTYERRVTACSLQTGALTCAPEVVVATQAGDFDADAPGVADDGAVAAWPRPEIKWRSTLRPVVRDGGVAFE